MADPSSQPHSFFKRQVDFSRLSLGLLPIAFLYMLAISWLKWPDLLIDFGVQVYIPWQLSEGKILYRDINYLHGPFSGYLHAFIFKLFGPAILYLAIFNCVLVILLTSITVWMLKKVSDDLTALLGGLLFITVFAFGQYAGGGNFNFITAYVYELPHGIILSFLALFLLYIYLEKPNRLRLAGLGVVTGMVYLTKPEVFLALCTAVILGLAVAFYLNASLKKELGKNIICFGFALFTFPVLFLVYLSWNMPFATALTAWTGPWLNVLNPGIRSLEFYKWIRGTDHLGKNLMSMAVYAGSFFLVFSSLMLLDRFCEARYSNKRWFLPVAYALCGGLFYFERHIPWQELLRPLPLIVLIFGIRQFIKAIQTRRDSRGDPREIFLMAFSAFAFILLFKIFFNTHVFHYGFALAFPAAILLVLIVLYEIPASSISFPRFLGTGRFYKHMTAILIVIFIAKHVGLSTTLYQLKNFPVGTGKDQIIDYYPFLNPRGEIVTQTLEYIEKEFPPEIQFTAIPYGSMINYLSRRTNPVPILTYNPGEALIIPENDYLEKIKEHSPPYILLLEVDSSIFGARYFGQDYAQNTLAWILNHYTLEKQFGQDPLSGTGFGIQILKRSDHSKQVLDG